ncbi:uncharacterized protein PHACADRAFT_258456 [Phanerochaete carnosa HHB-10118-sp]|uniref:Expansin-like EG45 domain-containing protein n=1 Tax=Phanerochaete carnosa (strain HHB-10118-sp) TaxID=650164 RepID=K5UWU2_PHACS|nr:uncharacterized protein PHACADRAFT_258456 [Phanerochaete carnosa HHB-10118-sp]EKM54536.1 hypothetical protein PHACADRAFT_258456 [Phanerochaete carnosa HHB-10118-sp]
MLLQLHALTLTLAWIPTALAQWLQYPPSGTATMTHYTLPDNYIAACGCTADSTHYPTAAMSQAAFGSSIAYGPACGRCFNLTLLNTYTPTPPFFPTVASSVVVKVTDLCPGGGTGLCSATPGHPNSGEQYINFDLAWPSSSISPNFFPSNVSLYGYSDFGVWNVSYEIVSCVDDWAGGHNAAALGSINQTYGVCCPANPNSTDLCPSYSDDSNAQPPDTVTSSAISSFSGFSYTIVTLYLLVRGTLSL